MLEDRQIIELYWQKNADAISETASKYGAYCFTIAENILHSTEDSEECVNDTWLHAWNAIPPQKPNILRLFLAKITRNLSFDRFNARNAEKRGGGEIALVLEELGECFGGGADTEAAYEAKELREAIQRLCGRCRSGRGMCWCAGTSLSSLWRTSQSDMVLPKTM